MAKLLKLRRGTNTQHSTFTGAEGEVTVNTTNDTLHVHDGTTAGGHELARADLSNVDNTSISNGTSNVSVAASGNITASRAGTTRLTVTGAGIDVTGQVNCDGLVVDGEATVQSSAGILNLKDTDSSGNATNNYVRGQNTNGASRWEIGQTTTGNEQLRVVNNANADIAFYTNGTLRALIQSDGHFRPSTDDTYDLGTASTQWRNGYFDGTVFCDAFDCPTAVTAGSYGSASAIPNFTVDSSGRLTAAGSSALNNASETVSGIVELATAAETTTGTSTTRAVHPAGLKVELDKKLDSDISSLPTLP